MNNKILFLKYKIFANLHKNAVIALNSCSTGALNGIAKKIASCAQRKVFAPTKPCVMGTTDFSNGEITYKYYSPFFFKTVLPTIFLFCKDVTRIINPNTIPKISSQYKPCLA